MDLLLAGDVGGTKTLLAIYGLEADGGLRLLRQGHHLLRRPEAAGQEGQPGSGASFLSLARPG